MNPYEETHGIGSQLGYDAAERVAQHAEDYSECERQRIILTNQAEINALYLEGRHLTAREHDLEERMRHAEPAGKLGHRRLTARYYWITGGILTTAAFFFTLIGFAPYRLGWVGILYCLGIAVVTPFGVEEFLQTWKNEKILKGVVTAVFISALIGGALLATIRGDLLSQQVERSSPEVAIDGEIASPPPASSFYESTRASLRMLMLFLALGLDLGAGVAVHRARATGTACGENYEKLSQELAYVRERLVAVVYEITALTNAPAVFVARFWRDFYRAMLTQATRKAMSKSLVLFLCLFLFGSGAAFAEVHVDRVVALDLSTSEDVSGHDQASQFDKNLKGVERLLSSVEAGSRITVIGITQDSFADPYILLRAEISPDQGYFGERLAAARRQIRSAWHDRAAHLAPVARGTDIFGAIRVASELLRTGPKDSKKILTIYSDMRNATRELDLETPLMVPAESMFAIVQQRHLLTDLTGVTVYVLGASATGRQVSEWESLQKFWITYFQRAGSTLSAYSILGDPPKSGY